jgi:hypothetical protein
MGGHHPRLCPVDNRQDCRKDGKMKKIAAIALAILQVAGPILLLWGFVALGSLSLSGCEVARYAAQCATRPNNAGCS